MLEFIDPPQPLRDAWVRWAEDADQLSSRPEFVAMPDLSDDNLRVTGVFVTPAAIAMGLRPWDDAQEGVEDETPWSLFDIEKIVRMMLHQSGLAFETLTAAKRWTRNEFPARRIASAAITGGILDYYRDITAPLAEGASERWRWRALLTAALLSASGQVSQDLQTLVEALGDDRVRPLLDGGTPDASVAVELRDALDGASLPSRPSNYDWLNDTVVEMRRSRPV